MCLLERAPLSGCGPVKVHLSGRLAQRLFQHNHGRFPNSSAFILKEPEKKRSTELSPRRRMDTPADPRSQAQPVAGGPRLASLGPLWPMGTLVDWSRPYRTCAVLAALSALLWLAALGPASSISVLSLLLAVAVLTPTAWSSRTEVSSADAPAPCWEVMHSEQYSSGLVLQMPSLQLLLKETCAFRQQHPGKFCLLVCSVCTFFAVLGRYIPGVVISYALVLGIFLWPLLSSVDLEPFLQKMDLGLVNFLHRIKENHMSGRSQPHAEAHAAESDLSSMLPQVDLSQCQELCVSDTEVSDISWTEGAFTLSEGHTPFSEGHTPLSEGNTPVTDQSEELDRDGLADHLPEFPSLDNGSITNDSSDEDNLYLAAPAPDPSAADAMVLSELGGQLVSAVIQQRMESALGLSGSSLGLCTGRLEDSDSDVEDFELLDQSELEQCETELGLVPQETEESPEPSGRHTVHGFISRLLRRQ